MEQQIWYTRWIEIDGNFGINYLPFDHVFNANNKTLSPTKQEMLDWYEGDKIDHIRILDGYGARLSMPGYLDATDWTVFATKEEAEQYLIETYDD